MKLFNLLVGQAWDFGNVLDCDKSIFLYEVEEFIH